MATAKTITTDAAHLRRGACPTLAAPMQTGDGLLARLRPLDCVVTLDELRTIAEAARTFGNGILEVTARGSLQIRGLKLETTRPFERAVLASGIVPASGVMVEVPPLAGHDPDELADIRPLAARLRAEIEKHMPPLALAPKLAVTIDGGGKFHLGDVTADVRLTALRDGVDVKFLLAVGGTGRTARPVVVLDEGQTVGALMAVLKAIAALGALARGKDIDLPSLGALYDPASMFPDPAFEGPQFLGIHDLGSGDVATTGTALGIALPYRQATADMLIAFANAARAMGIHEIRLAPNHGFFVTGLSAQNARTLQAHASDLGFWTSPSEPRANIALCSGTLGCASAYYDTRAAAEALARSAPDLLDGSIAIHLSGCAKGCAHPAAAPLTIIGAPSGYGLVVNGAASATPRLYFAGKDLGIAFSRLASLVAGAKEAGETARACLSRFGADRIAAALQLDGK